MMCEFCGVEFASQAKAQGPSRAAQQRFCSRRCAIYSRGRRGEFCKVLGCGRPDSARGYCSGHAWRLKHWGDVRADLPLRQNRARGEGNLDRGGYVSLYKPGHPNAQKNGLIFEHRLVMAEMLGRPLLRGETVHHKNGVKTDNAPYNLELRVGNHGRGSAVEDRVRDAVALLGEYAPDLLTPAADVWLERTYGPLLINDREAA